MGHGAGGRSDTVVVWFRRDLRLADHPALTEAVDRARRVVPLFVLDGHLLSQAAPARAWFLRGSLAELDASLRARGSGLLVHSGSPAEVVTDVARRYDAAVVWATRDVTPYSHRRDADVAAALARDGRRLKLRAGLLLAEPEAVSTAAGAPYGVFTPFWRSLQGLPRRPLLPAPDEIPSPPAVREGSADLAPGLTISASMARADWSSTEADLSSGDQARSTLAYGAGLELNQARLLGRPAPIRLGYRHSDLPFSIGTSEASERIYSGGLGLVLTQTGEVLLASVDLGLERGRRSAGSLTENFWRGTLSLKLSGL